ncbi:MAG: ABC transporter [Gallionellales bacterium RIFCSPLOWO2_02_FULL_57_47]|nr:MAG: ABC transporter [Gallionellales bacterium RIFCSPLOWO2_02_FULL_57_47]
MLFALIKKELLALIRDVHGLAALFLMPAVFIVIMSLALKDVYSPPVKTLPYAIENRDHGPMADTLVAEWEKRHGKPQTESQNWQDRVQSGKLSYALVIEKDFSNVLVAGQTDSEIQLRLITDPGLDGGVFAANQAELVMIASEMRARALLTAARMAQAAPRGRPAAANAKATDSGVTVSAQALVEAERYATGFRPTAVQQNVPAWLVFGMFFVVASLSNLFLQERQCGALARLASLGVPVSTMIWSKALPYLVINGLQAALMLAVGVWLMPLLGGDALSLAGINWGALLLVLLAVSMSAIGLALALASLVRTQAQASALGPVVNILMAAIGGVMVPKFVMPDAMQRIAEFSPMNWGLEGMLAVLLRGSDMNGVLLPSAKLMGFATLMVVIAVLLFRRRVN